MPSDETTIIRKEDLKPDAFAKLQMAGESQFGGITIRGWLAIAVIISVCIVELSRCAMSILNKDFNYQVSGEFMMMASGIMAHYFTQRNNEQKNGDKPQPEPPKTP